MATAKQRLEYEVRLKDLASQALRNMGETAKKQTGFELKYSAPVFPSFVAPPDFHSLVQVLF